DSPDSRMGFKELTNFLEYVCDEHDLPIDPADSGLTDRIFDSLEKYLDSSLTIVESFGYVASERFRTFRYKAERSPIRGWQPHRAFISGYHTLTPAQETGAPAPGHSPKESPAAV